jgi:hypothetical protein
MLLQQLVIALSRRPAKQRSKPADEFKSYSGPIAAGQGIAREPSIQALWAAVEGNGDDVLEAFLALPASEQTSLVEAEINKLPEGDKLNIMRLLSHELNKVFIPNPGPQTQALLSKADLLLYGGGAGSGKSFLSIGCAATEHDRSLILRRHSVELDGLIKDSHDMLQGRGTFRGAPETEWRLNSGASIRFGGVKEPEDWRKYRGQARDLMVFDEAAEFLEEQVSSLMAWNRSTDPKQRCRVILASNPPSSDEGRWILKWFAPWLDPSFPVQVRSGQLAYAIQVGDETRWIDDPEFDESGRVKPILIGDEQYTPMSRTFIPAVLQDNPYLARTNYLAVLQSKPEPLRSQLLKGDFLAGRRDDDWQVIPTEWVEAAQARWLPQPPLNAKMTSLGVDLAHGGADATIVAPRYGAYFASLKEVKGLDTKDGGLMAGMIFTTARDGAEIVLDAGGGYASGPHEQFKAMGVDVTLFLGSEGSAEVSKEGLRFRNRRAEIWWRLKEALDPSGNAYIALPPDPQLKADLTTPRWRITGGGILIESKEDIRKRLGRSPDRGDAVAMAWAHGTARQQQRESSHRMPVKANVGYANLKRRRF